MALPANAKITALVCKGLNRPNDSSGIKPRKSGQINFRATIKPTRNPMTPHIMVAIPKFRTILLS
jgi:hypothetical protein